MAVRKEKIYQLKLYGAGFLIMFISTTIALVGSLLYPDIFLVEKQSVIIIHLLLWLIIPTLGAPIMIYLFAKKKKSKWLLSLLGINILILLIGLVLKQDFLILSTTLIINVTLRKKWEKIDKTTL